MRIIAGSVLLACLLGIAVDLVTANVAVEYFSVYHPHVIDSDSPWVLALVWGVMATWWCGAIVGVTLWFTKSRLKVPPTDTWMLRSVAYACATIWATMMTILLAVYVLGGFVPMDQRRATFEHDRRLVAVAVAHAGEYVLAAIALAAIVALMIRYSRGLSTDLSRSSDPNHS